MSAAPLLFAAGSNGLTLTVPDGVKLTQGAAIDPAAPLSESEQRALVAAALNSASLKEVAAGKRRVAILAGDLCRPAPYDIALPTIVAALVEAGIRPSRIACLACPGASGALLGRAAIHRYGEELCGDHEVIAWPASGSPGALYDTADLRIAVSPIFQNAGFLSFLPSGVSADFALELTLGRKTLIDIVSARARTPDPRDVNLAAPQIDKADVLLSSGGGARWEETLEEALLSLHTPPVTARAAVLIFSGHEGLGSAHFTRDLWSLIAQADELLAAGGTLGLPSPPGPYDPAGTLADCFRRYSNTVLFSPGLAEHPEGEDLLERLEEAPRVAARLALCGSQQDLWNALALLHGPGYTLYAEPLGWRA